MTTVILINLEGEGSKVARLHENLAALIAEKERKCMVKLVDLSEKSYDSAC